MKSTLVRRKQKPRLRHQRSATISASVLESARTQSNLRFDTKLFKKKYTANSIYIHSGLDESALRYAPVFQRVSHRIIRLHACAEA